MDYKDIAEVEGTKGLKIIHVNTRSVLKKLDELKLRLKHFDIVVFTETWLNDSINDSLLEWEEFNLVRCDRGLNRNKKGGGVCIYVRDTIPYKIIDDYNDFRDNNLEFILLRLNPYMQKTLNLCGIYRPPDGIPKECVERLAHIVNQFDRARTETVLIGDFNLDYRNKKLVSTSKLGTLVSKLSLKQLINKNTRITRTSASCIDLLFTDISCVSQSGVVNYNISDHLPIYMVKKKSRTKIKRTVAFGRSYLNYSEDVFVRLLNQSSWEDFELSNNPQKLWDIFHQNIVKTLDQLCPIRKLTVVENKPEWLNNDLLLLMRQRDKAYRRARRTNRPVDWDIARVLRNRVIMEVRTSKANVIKEKLDRYQHNPKKFWQEINKLLPTAHASMITGIIDESSGEEVPDEFLMNHINEYFSNIGSKLAGECTPGGVEEDPLIPKLNLTIFNRFPFTELEVLKICKDINVTKSAAIENVKSHVLKCAFISNISRITKIFNRSLSQSIFPHSWKLSTIVPLPKVSHPKSASDMRPVALTPLPGKLMEKLICSRLQEWLRSNNILSETQHGFRKNKSTVSAIAQLLNDIYTYINQRLNPYILFLDLKKAFDTVSHVKMLSKLKVLGMDLSTLMWFESYLNNRQQCVRLNGVTSSMLPISFGVPQGSILGPILFSIYINEIADIVNCGVVLYADDTVLYHNDKHILQNNLNRISKWCNNNLLTINAKKSHSMKLKVCGELTDPDVQPDVPFVINSLNLQPVKMYKYLGVLIDVNLNFQSHHNKVVANVQSKLSHFKKIRFFLTKRAAILIYKCTILPLLEYADFICDQGIAYVNKSLQKLQNMGLSVAFNQHVQPFAQRDSSDALHRQCNVFRLIHRRRLHLLQFALVLKSNRSLLDKRDIPTRRRDGILFVIPKSNHYKFPLNPYYRCMVEWNNLQVDMTLMPNREVFKKAIKANVRDPFTKVLK